MLAARYGGTPWQWREHADERDWAVMLGQILKESEEANGRA